MCTNVWYKASRCKCDMARNWSPPYGLKAHYTRPKLVECRECAPAYDSKCQGARTRVTATTPSGTNQWLPRGGTICFPRSTQQVWRKNVCAKNVSCLNSTQLLLHLETEKDQGAPWLEAFYSSSWISVSLPCPSRLRSVSLASSPGSSAALPSSRMPHRHSLMLPVICEYAQYICFPIPPFLFSPDFFLGSIFRRNWSSVSVKDLAETNEFFPKSSAKKDRWNEWVSWLVAFLHLRLQKLTWYVALCIVLKSFFAICLHDMSDLLESRWWMVY